MRGMNVTWAIVLAAGDGTRLSELTTDEQGRSIPKQYCSFRGGPSLLAETITRAHSIASRGRVVTIVAADHRRFWERELQDLPARDIVAQPRNRGTAVGLLLPLLGVLERDPEASVCMLPSDHHVRSEHVIAAALRQGLRALDERPEAPVLLGITPHMPEPDYGWIGPEPGNSRLRGVRVFVEKPTPVIARELHESGALWNSFLLAARARALMDLYSRRLPRLLAALRRVFELPHADRGPALERLYAEVETADSSRDVLQGSEEYLRVLEVPPCGWTDLGTPEGVAACLRENHASGSNDQGSSRAHARAEASINLADVLELRGSVVDGEWRGEEACEESRRNRPHCAPSPFGTMNCVMEVP